MRKSKPPGKKPSRRQPVARKTAPRAAVRRRVVARYRASHEPAPPHISPDFVPLTVATPPAARGLGPESAGQSGDTTGLSRSGSIEYESVEQLVEEGQAFEAGVLTGIESASDADPAEVTTREVPVDDVPAEYFEPVERR